VNRTDRLYALVEELRACAPRRLSARELAARYEVSVRTIERDISALQQAGVPIYADVGRGGGYTLDKSRTLPPLNFTPAEAVAVAITLSRAEGSPYSRSARTALHKIVAAMSADDGASARELAARIRFLAPAAGDDDRASVPAVLEEAVLSRRVVRLTYVDKSGCETERDVEPAAFTASDKGWYLTGWCRMRGDRRVFRTDRVRRAVLLEETAPDRSGETLPDDLPSDYIVRTLEFA
jgi:predicted DNA-binding transcriptional regulator YafY